jgi:outer membrane protein assembly factor BamB
MRRRILLGLLLAGCFAGLSLFTAAQENWPQWRGERQNGICDSEDLPVKWSLDENVVWKTPLPSWSAATPIIWGDRIFVVSPSAGEKESGSGGTSPDGQNQRRGRREAGRNPGGPEIHLFCISRSDGKILWKKELDSNNQLHRKQNDATPSPVTDGRFVWAVTGTGVVKAFDMDGTEIWAKNLQEEYGPFGLNWGYGSSPLLYGGNIIIPVLHGMKTDDPSYIISLDGKTGKVNWRRERPTDAERESPDAYTTPVLLEQGGKAQIIISGADYVTGHDPETGEEIWRAAGLNPLKRPNYRVVGTPIINGEIIFVPTRKKPLIALKSGGTGDITSSHLLWKYEGAGASDVPSPVCDGKYLYLVEDRGMVTCLDARTGAEIYGPLATNEGIVSASPILAGGRIYILNEEGETTVVAAGPEFKILGTNSLDGSYTLASPAVSGQRIFIRTETHLYCIGKQGVME